MINIINILGNNYIAQRKAQNKNDVVNKPIGNNNL